MRNSLLEKKPENENLLNKQENLLNNKNFMENLIAFIE